MIWKIKKVHSKCPKIYMVMCLSKEALTGNSALKHETCRDWELSKDSVALPQHDRQLSTPLPRWWFQHIQVGNERCREAACGSNKTKEEIKLFLTCSTVTGLGVECPWYASRICSFIFRTERLLALGFWFSFFWLGLALKLTSAFAFIN